MPDIRGQGENGSRKNTQKILAVTETAMTNFLSVLKPKTSNCSIKRCSPTVESLQNMGGNRRNLRNCQPLLTVNQLKSFVRQKFSSVLLHQNEEYRNVMDMFLLRLVSSITGRESV